MLALDQFVLWVNAKSPFKTAGEYLDAVKAGNDRQFSMGGTGSRQEDQIITAALERYQGPRSSPTCRSRVAARSPCSWSADMSTRRSTIRSRRWRNGRRGISGRCASSTARAVPTRARSRNRWRGATSRRARKPAWTSSTRCSAAFSCRPASIRSRWTSTSIFSTRWCRRRIGNSSWSKARSTRRR